MRPHRISIGLIACVALTVTFSCSKDSNTVAGPSGSASTMNLSGSWSGTFLPNDTNRCTRSNAIVTLQQQGSNLTGNISTSVCGVGGYFRGTLQGNMISGKVEMAGCTGGSVTGTATANSVTLSISDLMKPLVLGDVPAMAGGSVSLTR